MTARLPILVVGAGPVGLALSLALSRWAVRHVVVERHPGTAIHPKARGVDVRTMEMFRRWQLEEGVRAAGLPAEEHGYFFRGATLTSPHFERFGGGGEAGDARRLSPTTWLVIGQDALEPVLLARTRSLGQSDVRFRHELVGFEQDRDAVVATISRRDTAGTYELEASFLVGADGAGSPTRERLGVDLIGRGPLVRNSSILFRSDLTGVIADRRSAVYYLTGDAETGDGERRPRGYPMSVGNPPANGALLAINNRDRWLLVVGHPADDPSVPEGAAAAALVRRAVGIDDLDVEILSVLPWTPAARVAERYRSGHVFLAGDAAHETTPSGAFGLNVGIQDADNLGWKLGAVLAGWAGPGLLDTYDAERRPVARAAAEQSYLQFSGQRPPRPFGNWGMILGTRYESEAIIPDGSPPPPVADATIDYIPVARPGHRLPHAWLGATGEGRSTLDVLGPGFTLLTRNGEWADAASQVAHPLDVRREHRPPVPLDIRLLAGDLEPADPESFASEFGIGGEGALLVRPDGYVAWRSRAAGTRGTLARLLADTLRGLTAR